MKMPLLSIPIECFYNILSFLNERSLYVYLFINRYWCTISIPILWRDPFVHNSKVINTLLSFLNEDEISSLIPYAINLPNNKYPLFEYGKYIRKIDQYNVRKLVKLWLKDDINDCKVQKLINIIYHVIMRQGCNLQNLSLYFDLPNPSIFTNYEPGIKNLRNLHSLHSFTDKYEFLSMLSIICNNIIEYNIIIGESNEINPISDIIKLQPLEKIFIEFSYSSITKKFIPKIIKALEFRSKTLKKLVFKYFDFQSIELSFITKLECLKHLDFQYCSVLEQKHCKTLSKKNSQINYFSLWYNYYDDYDDVKLINGTKTMIDYVAGESLRRLDLNVVTLEIIREIKESCPNITFLHIKIEELQDSVTSVISLICELSSLKILNIQADNYTHSIIRILGDCLRSVESLYLSFHVDLISFEYFTINCKANLKNWIIPRDISYFDNNTKGFLECVSNYQKVHNSLKKLGVRDREIDKEELKIIINYLMNQGVNVVSETSIALEMF